MFPLQNKVSVIHENINEGFRVDERSVPENNACIINNGPSMMQFVSLHSSTTPHNTHVKSKIIKEIVETPGCTYSEVEVTGIYYNNVYINFVPVI